MTVSPTATRAGLKEHVVDERSAGAVEADAELPAASDADVC